MMSMHHPYGNTNTAGQNFYRTAVCPTFGVNYNQYFAPLYANSNGLLPTPLMESTRPLMAKPYEGRYEMKANDFLTFIEQKTKPMSELNPFANEFSSAKNNSLVPMNGNEKSSSYKLIFDDLIEQSLQSIDAIKRASKTVSVNHVSTQCHPSIDQIDRSTQTTNDNDQYHLLEEYSSRTMKSMENFKYLFGKASLRCVYDELHYLVSVMNQLILSINGDNLCQDSSIPSAPILHGIDDRIRRMISSTPSFSSRQIDPITLKRSKLCLLCQKPVNENEDALHELCRLLSSPPNSSK